MNPARIQELLEAARNRRVLVIGDVMLDEFVWGRVSRISPEAPVPVVEVEKETSYPGGAANVARNLQAFCKQVIICGLVGEDAAASRLQNLLAAENIDTAGLVASSLPTIVKTRIVARHQQVVRVDREKKAPAPQEALNAAIEHIRGILPHVDAVIFEDYGKGLLTQPFLDQVCDLIKQHDLVVTADPNPTNPLHWRDVKVLKPNRSEAFAMAGLPDPGATEDPLTDAALQEAAGILLEKLQIPALLITLGEHGMLLLERDSAPFHTPTRAQEVFDVSGAGDTAIAIFTLALASGSSLREAAEAANHAAGVVVGKLGTATILPEELADSFTED